MMDKQINLFRNVFKEEQERRRRLVISSFAMCLLALCAWGISDHASRADRLAQAELARVDGALQIEQGLVAALAKAQKESAKPADVAVGSLRSGELDLLSKGNPGVAWTALGSMLRDWSLPGTRFKKVALIHGTLTVFGEARTQAQARAALELISRELGEHGAFRSLQMEFKASDTLVGFSWTGALDAKEEK